VVGAQRGDRDRVVAADVGEGGDEAGVDQAAAYRVVTVPADNVAATVTNARRASTRVTRATEAPTTT
jgi:hypothetical protein